MTRISTSTANPNKWARLYDWTTSDRIYTALAYYLAFITCLTIGIDVLLNNVQFRFIGFGTAIIVVLIFLLDWRKVTIGEFLDRIQK